MDAVIVRVVGRRFGSQQSLVAKRALKSGGVCNIRSSESMVTFARPKRAVAKTPMFLKSSKRVQPSSGSYNQQVKCPPPDFSGLDGKHWSVIADRRHGPWRGMKTAISSPVEVKYVRFAGTFSNREPFRVQRVQAFPAP